MKSTAEFFNKYDYQGLLSSDMNNSTSLFHYATVGTMLTILKNKQFRFSNRLYLNDYSEGQYVLDLCEESIDDIWPEKSRYKKDVFVDALSKLSINLANRQFSIYQLSLSKNGDSLSMWNYYAKGDGVNIRLLSAKLFESLEEQFLTEAQWPVGFLHGSVVYDKQKQIEILKRLLSDFSQSESLIDEWYLFTSWAALYIGTFFKHHGFCNEQEYRISFNPFFDAYEPEKCLTLKSSKREEPYRVDVYQKENMLVPYIDIDFDEEAVTGITLSPRAEKDSIEAGLRIALHRNGFDTKRVVIEKSEIPVRF